MASLGLPGAVCARFVRLDCRILGHAAPDEELLPRDLRSLPQHDLLPQMETAASLSPQQRLHLRLAPPEGTHRCALVQPPQQSLFSPSQLPRHGHPRRLEQYLGGRLGRPAPRPHPAFCRYALSLPSFTLIQIQTTGEIRGWWLKRRWVSCWTRRRSQPTGSLPPWMKSFSIRGIVRLNLGSRYL